MIEKSLLVLMIVLVPSHRMEGGPKGRQLPVQGGGGDDSWHRAAEDDSHQDPAPQGRCAHHSRHSRLISINTPEYERHHVKAFRQILYNNTLDSASGLWRQGSPRRERTGRWRPRRPGPSGRGRARAAPPRLVCSYKAGKMG